MGYLVLLIALVTMSHSCIMFLWYEPYINIRYSLTNKIGWGTVTYIVVGIFILYLAKLGIITERYTLYYGVVGIIVSINLYIGYKKGKKERKRLAKEKS